MAQEKKAKAVTTPPKLTPKQRRFVEEYCVDFNGTRAAIEAGYAQRSAAATAWENLRKPEIQDAISAHADRLMQQATMSALDVVTGLCRIASANPLDYFDVSVSGAPVIDLSELSREQAYAIQSIKTESFAAEGEDSGIVTKTEVKFEPKIQALTTLAKYHGLLLGKRGGAGDLDDPDAIDLTEVDEDELTEEIIYRRQTGDVEVRRKQTRRTKR